MSPVISVSSLLTSLPFTNLLTLLKSNINLSVSLSSSNPVLEVGNGPSASVSSINYFSSDVVSQGDVKYSFLEQSSLSRFSRFSNPIISYDYKCGNYIGI
jgi:hypothetical protein